MSKCDLGTESKSTKNLNYMWREVEEGKPTQINYVSSYYEVRRKGREIEYSLNTM